MTKQRVPTRGAMKAEQALEALRANRRIRNVTISGTVMPEIGEKFEHFIILNSIIKGNVNIWEAVINGDFDLTGTKITGNLEAQGVTISGNATAMNLTVGGSLELSHAIINGTLDLTGASIQVQMNLDGSQIPGHIYMAFKHAPESILVSGRPMAERMHLHAPNIPLAFGIDEPTSKRLIKISKLFHGHALDMVGRHIIAAAHGTCSPRYTLGQQVTTSSDCTPPETLAVITGFQLPRQNGDPMMVSLFAYKVGPCSATLDQVKAVEEPKF